MRSHSKSPSNDCTDQLTLYLGLAAATEGKVVSGLHDIRVCSTWFTLLVATLSPTAVVVEQTNRLRMHGCFPRVTLDGQLRITL